MATGTGIMYKVTQVAVGVAGSPYYLTGYFELLAGTAQQAADAWRAMLSGGVATYVAPLSFNAITEVGKVDPVTGNLVGIDGCSVPAQTFTAAGDPLPAATSLLLRWRTGEYVNGKEIRGRTNIPRMSEVDNVAGVPQAALLSTWQARQNTLVAGVTFKHLVWSPKNGVWARTAAGSPWGQWAVLRSRRD